MSAAVTIVLPFRNAAPYLDETLASVEAQTFKDWLLWIIDDGSTDASVETAKTFAARHPSRVRYSRLGGVGAAAARNFVVSQVTTRYVAFLDADDVWTAEKLDRQVSLMKEAGAVFSYTSFRKLDSASNLGGTSFAVPPAIAYSQLLRGNPIRCFTVMYDQAKLGPVLMPGIKMRNDLLAWLDVLRRVESAKKGEVLPGASEPFAAARPVLGINEVLGYYRQHTSSLTGNKLRAAKYQWIAYRRYLGLSISRSLWTFSHYALNGIKTYAKR